jgi:hypothetical protein
VQLNTVQLQAYFSGRVLNLPTVVLPVQLM